MPINKHSLPLTIIIFSIRRKKNPKDKTTRVGLNACRNHLIEIRMVFLFPSGLFDSNHNPYTIIKMPVAVSNVRTSSSYNG